MAEYTKPEKMTKIHPAPPRPSIYVRAMSAWSVKSSRDTRIVGKSTIFRQYSPPGRKKRARVQTCVFRCAQRSSRRLLRKTAAYVRTQMKTHDIQENPVHIYVPTYKYRYTKCCPCVERTVYYFYIFDCFFCIPFLTFALLFSPS